MQLQGAAEKTLLASFSLVVVDGDTFWCLLLLLLILLLGAVCMRSTTNTTTIPIVNTYSDFKHFDRSWCKIRINSGAIQYLSCACGYEIFKP